MKQLVFDKLKRLAWKWINIGVMGLCLGVCTSYFRSPHFLALIVLVAFCLLGISSSITELRSGYGRIVLTLPFTPRQIGRALWLVSVGLPTLVVGISAGLGTLLSALGSSTFGDSLVVWLHIVLMSGLFFGSSFWLGSAQPHTASTKKEQIASNLHTCAFWLVFGGIGYGLYEASLSLEIKYIIVCLLMLPFALLSWHRAESLLVDYGECRQLALTGATSSRNFRPPAGFGGLRFLYINLASQLSVMMLPTLIFVYLFFYWLSSQPVRPEMWTLFLLFSGIPGLGVITSLCAHQKFLRTLPISSKQLAGVFLLLTTGPYALISVLTGIWLSWSQGLAAGIWIFYTSAFGLALIGCLAIAFVRYTEDTTERAAFVALVIVLPVVIPICLIASWGIDLPLAFVILYPLACLIGSFFAIAHCIETNDLAYRRRNTNDAWTANQ